jgi:hypothetical protein
LGGGEANLSKLHLLVKPEQASSWGGKKHIKETKQRKEKSTSGQSTRNKTIVRSLCSRENQRI